MIVIDQNDVVSVQFSDRQMDELRAYRDKWVANWEQTPAMVNRYLERRASTRPLQEVLEEHRAKVLLGFMGELALCQYFGVDYHYAVVPGDVSPTDVDGVEVRSTDSFTKRLITHSYDKPTAYVLAVCDEHVAVAYLRGWLHLRDCNVAKHLAKPNNGPWAYFTPATALHPMDTLRNYYLNRKRRLNNGV